MAKKKNYTIRILNIEAPEDAKVEVTAEGVFINDEHVALGEEGWPGLLGVHIEHCRIGTLNVNGCCTHGENNTIDNAHFNGGGNVELNDCNITRAIYHGAGEKEEDQA